MPRRTCDFIFQRDAEIMRRYSQIVRERNCRSQRDVMLHVVKSSASRFYVSSESLERVIRHLRQGGNLDNMSESKRAMYEELYNRYKEHRKMPEYSKMRIRHLCEILVDEPAPEFYIQAETAMDIFNVVKRRKRHSR